MNEFEVDIALQYQLQTGNFRPVFRYMQPLTAHVVPASVQIKSEELRLTRPEMRVAVGVHRKRTDGRDALAHDPFDGGADLATH